jgi:tellurite resistance protein TehA-like permease
MLMACYAMFGMSVIASMIIITLIWSRLAHYGSSGTARVPTLWIVLGPLGQSITGVGLLGTVALTATDAPLSTALNLFAVLYGVPVWGFALMWACIATMLTIRTVRRKLPFALTWWSFTFPVGTCVTGTTQLAKHTELPIFSVLAVAFFFGLLSAWLLVALRTLRGVYRTDLLTPPKNPPVLIARKDTDPIED